VYLFYIDESSTGLKQLKQPFFTLASLGVRLEDWHTLDEAVTRYKRQWVTWAEPEDFELKARDIRHGHGMFSGLEWERRCEILICLGELIGELPVNVAAVVVDKRNLPSTIESEEQLYRGAFWQLLDVLTDMLRKEANPGLLIMDSRSDLHTSVQDRRLIDAYRRYVAVRGEQPPLVELPLFGNSEFYSGLQLADFAAHIIALAHQRGYVRSTKHPPRTPEETAYQAIAHQIRQVVALP